MVKSFKSLPPNGGSLNAIFTSVLTLTKISLIETNLYVICTFHYMYVSGFIPDMFKLRETTGGDGQQQDHHQEGSDAFCLKCYAA